MRVNMRAAAMAVAASSMVIEPHHTGTGGRPPTWTKQTPEQAERNLAAAKAKRERKQAHRRRLP